MGATRRVESLKYEQGRLDAAEEVLAAVCVALEPGFVHDEVYAAYERIREAQRMMEEIVKAAREEEA